MWEGVKRAAKVGYVPGGQVREGGLIWVAGKDAGGGSGLEGDVVFHLRGEPGLGLTFLPDHQLEAEMSLEVGVQAYSDENYIVPEGEVNIFVIVSVSFMLCSESTQLSTYFYVHDLLPRSKPRCSVPSAMAWLSLMTLVSSPSTLAWKQRTTTGTPIR